MDSQELCELSLAQQADLVRTRQVSPVELIEASLRRVSEYQPSTNAFITVLGDRAAEEARRSETEIADGRYRGPLHGIPFAAKDNFYTRGIPTTSGLKYWLGFLPAYSSWAVSQLETAGAILIGKANMEQLAFGCAGENRDFGAVRNPLNLKRTAGGSSSGSAAATASGMCSFALGSDTGGSIRMPSAMCGIVGLKPTYDLLSRYGLTPLSWSLDAIGPMARSVEDTAIVMDGLLRDQQDSDLGPYSSAVANGGVSGIRIGLITELAAEETCEKEILTAFFGAVETLGDLGAEVIEVSWPNWHLSQPISAAIQGGDAASLFGDLLAHADALDPFVRQRVQSGLLIPAADYVRAHRVARLLLDEVLELFGRVDILATPTVPSATCDVSVLESGTSNLSLLGDFTRTTRPFTVTGLPAVTVPCSFGADGTGIGIQLAAAHYHEPLLMAVASALERASVFARAGRRIEKSELGPAK